MRGGTARTHRRGDHRDTLSSRNNLAGAYQSAGDLGRAIPLYEQTLADRQRVLAEQAEFWLYEDEYDTSLRMRLWDIPSTGYEAISTVPPSDDPARLTYPIVLSAANIDPTNVITLAGNIVRGSLHRKLEARRHDTPSPR
jgi:hypothetical protein